MKTGAVVKRLNSVLLCCGVERPKNKARKRFCSVCKSKILSVISRLKTSDRRIDSVNVRRPLTCLPDSPGAGS